MSTSFNSYQKRRLRSSYLSVVISIALVLFMVGILGLMLLKSSKAAAYFKEKIAITLFLKDEVTKENIAHLKKSIEDEPFTNKVFYVSKKQAATKYAKDIGEDFLNFLGANPLKNGIDIYLKAPFVSAEKMELIEQKYLKNTFVLEVSYDKPLIKLLTENIQKVSLWLFILSGFLALIAVVLINSAVRLSVYSKRFTIKTMQMVGATKSFIRKPFLWQHIQLGVFGAFIALIGIGACIYYANQFVPALELMKDIPSLCYLSIGVLLTSIIITFVSAFFATQRFLNLQTDQLY